MTNKVYTISLLFLLTVALCGCETTEPTEEIDYSEVIIRINKWYDFGQDINVFYSGPVDRIALFTNGHERKYTTSDFALRYNKGLVYFKLISYSRKYAKIQIMREDDE